MLKYYIALLFSCVPLTVSTLLSSDVQKISVTIVNQPLSRQIIMKDKNNELPTIKIILLPVENTMIIKESQDGRMEEKLNFSDLCKNNTQLYNANVSLNGDIHQRELVGITNVTPRMVILYRQCLDIYHQFLMESFD